MASSWSERRGIASEMGVPTDVMTTMYAIRVNLSIGKQHRPRSLSYRTSARHPRGGIERLPQSESPVLPIQEDELAPCRRWATRRGEACVAGWRISLYDFKSRSLQALGQLCPASAGPSAA